MIVAPWCVVRDIPVYIGFRFIGKKFTMYSCLMIFLSSALTDILPGYVITYDTLLIGIFGGLINGLVISLCLAVNATTGGTDFIAIFLSDRTNDLIFSAMITEARHTTNSLFKSSFALNFMIASPSYIPVSFMKLIFIILQNVLKWNTCKNLICTPVQRIVNLRRTSFLPSAQALR